FTVRPINRCVALRERIMRVRIKESSFCLRAFRATLASFRMAAARSTVAHVPRRQVIAWQREILCATVMATGETLDLRELRCRSNLEYRFAYADGKPLDRPRQLWCVEPAGNLRRAMKANAKCGCCSSRRTVPMAPKALPYAGVRGAGKKTGRSVKSRRSAFWPTRKSCASASSQAACGHLPSFTKPLGV